MATSVKDYCVMCEKAIKSTEIVLLCGLWCRNSFHIECVGLSNREARSLQCSKVQLKFHCEPCEKRLAIELFGGKKTLEAQNLENCVSLLELVQKLVRLTNELSYHSTTVNSKLDTVLSSNARLEEYLLPSPKCFEKQNEGNDNSERYAESDSTDGVIEILKQNNDSNSHDHIIKGERMCLGSEFQQNEDNACDFPEQLANGQQQNLPESFSSNGPQEWEVSEGQDSIRDPLSIDDECMQDWEELDGQDGMKDILNIVKEEGSLSEDFLISGMFSIEKAENGENEEKEMMEYDVKKFSSSAFLQPSTLKLEKKEKKVDDGTVDEDISEELQHEIESAISGGGAESYNPTGVKDDKISKGNYGLVTTIAPAAKTGPRKQNTMEQEASSGNNTSTRKLRKRSDVCKKTFGQMDEQKEQTHVDRCELLYSCCICRKTFSKSSHLSRHFRIHSGERPYSCRDCKKTFIHSSHLKRHSLLHVGGGIRSSKVCLKELTRMNDLREHSQSDTEEKRYGRNSDKEQYTGEQQCGSNSDKEWYTGEKRNGSNSDKEQYSCNICLSQFTYYNNWRNHMLLHT